MRPLPILTERGQDCAQWNKPAIRQLGLASTVFFN